MAGRVGATLEAPDAAAADDRDLRYRGAAMQHVAAAGDRCAQRRLGANARLAAAGDAHRDLVRDPEGTLHRIYDWLGLELTGEVERSILAWQDENRMGAKGKHTYTPEQFGLTAEQIRADYDFYIRRFDVAVEG